ncbi:MAG: hypothetical protein RR448_09470 [Niameybacter sp.]|uniref:hypothetical protein n=1 Tax=Niameybacter sp. TaxID=2033640 RepID=UPI002FC984CB
MKKVCPKCHYENSADALYCVNCQADLKGFIPREGTQTNSNDFTGYNISNMTPLGRQLRYPYQEDVSIATWVGVTLGMSIPLVNIIMLICILVFTSQESLKNYAIAQFIVIGIGLVFLVVLPILFSSFY